MYRTGEAHVANALDRDDEPVRDAHGDVGGLDDGLLRVGRGQVAVDLELGVVADGPVGEVVVTLHLQADVVGSYNHIVMLKLDK